jgi:hypothetical protein
MAWGRKALPVLCLTVLLGAGVAHAVAPEVDPAVAKWQAWPHLVACQNGVPFNPIAAFSRPPDAERGKGAAERALARVLNRKIFGGYRPKHGWRRLAQRRTAVDFGRGRLAAGIELIELQFHEGRWQEFGAQANCKPRSVRGGRRAVTWSLLPGERLDPETKKVKVKLSENDCNFSSNPAKRLAKPEFREANGALLMSLWDRRPAPSESTCEGGDIVVTIELPEELGERRLMDGGVFPPVAG